MENIIKEKVSYILVNDSKGNSNIWLITDEFSVDGQDTYEIHTRTTCAFVEKEFCFLKQGSSLLYYENGDRIIDVNDSEIEVDELELELSQYFKCDKCLYLNNCRYAHLVDECEYYCDGDTVDDELGYGYWAYMKKLNDGGIGD